MRACPRENPRRAASIWLTCLGLAMSSAISLVVTSFAAAEVELGARDRIQGLLEKLENPDDGVVVVAHRGCWSGGAPENSIAAIEQCVKIGVDMVEVDVALSRDGVPVLLHDDSLERTTGVVAKPSEFDWAALRKMRLLEGAGGSEASLSPEMLPSLEEALASAQGRILVNLDVKGTHHRQALEVAMRLGVQDQVLMKMAAAPDSPALVGAPFLGRTLFMPIIRECTKANLNNNCTPRLSTYVASYAPYRPVAYEITYSSEQFLNEGMDAIRGMGARIWVNTLSPHHAAGVIDGRAIEDPAGTWGRVIELGGSIIQTDYPGLLIKYLRGRVQPEPDTY